MPWLDLKVGILEEFVSTVSLSKQRTNFRELNTVVAPYLVDCFVDVIKRRARGRAYYHRHKHDPNYRERAREKGRARYNATRETNVEERRARNRTHARTYRHRHKHDPNYRERARARALAHYYATRETSIEERRARNRAYYHRHKEELRARKEGRNECKSCKAPKVPGRSRCAAHLLLARNKARVARNSFGKEQP